MVDEIFLGEITTGTTRPSRPAQPASWPATCPTTKIVPVYRSDASGRELPALRLPAPPGRCATSPPPRTPSSRATPASPPPPGRPVRLGRQPVPTTYPGWAAGNLVGQNGSDNAANYVSALSSNGAITYVETAYAKEHNFPVASVANASGNAVQPTSVNDATALEAAILHADLTQDLTNVYTNPLPNAYPLSAYSYLVTPCSPQLAAAQPRPVAPADRRVTPVPAARRARRSASSSPSWPVPARRRWPRSATRRCRRTWSRRTSTPSAV